MRDRNLGRRRVTNASLLYHTLRPHRSLKTRTRLERSNISKMGICILGHSLCFYRSRTALWARIHGTLASQTNGGWSDSLNVQIKVAVQRIWFVNLGSYPIYLAMGGKIKRLYIRYRQSLSSRLSNKNNSKNHTNKSVRARSSRQINHIGYGPWFRKVIRI